MVCWVWIWVHCMMIFHTTEHFVPIPNTSFIPNSLQENSIIHMHSPIDSLKVVADMLALSKSTFTENPHQVCMKLPSTLRIAICTGNFASVVQTFPTHRTTHCSCFVITCSITRQQASTKGKVVHSCNLIQKRHQLHHVHETLPGSIRGDQPH